MMEKISINAENISLGRLASQVARILMGKDSVYYQPHKVPEVVVEVINASKLRLTGKKRKNKLYYRYSGYPGGLKTTKLDDLMKKDPSLVVKKAVSNMLPKNRLHKLRMKRLKVIN